MRNAPRAIFALFGVSLFGGGLLPGASFAELYSSLRTRKDALTRAKSRGSVDTVELEDVQAQLRKRAKDDPAMSRLRVYSARESACIDSKGRPRTVASLDMEISAKLNAGLNVTPTSYGPVPAAPSIPRGDSH